MHKLGTNYRKGVVKTLGLYTGGFNNMVDGGKKGFLGTLYTRFLRTFYHTNKVFMCLLSALFTHIPQPLLLKQLLINN